MFEQSTSPSTLTSERLQRMALAASLPVAGVMGYYIAVRGLWAAGAMVAAVCFVAFLAISLNRLHTALVPLALVVPVGGYLVVHWPEAGFSLIIDALALLPFAALVMRWLVRPREINLFSGAQLLVWAFLLAALFQFVNPDGTSVTVTLYGLRLMIVPMLLFFVGFHLDLSGVGRLRRLAWLFTLTGLIPAVWGLKQHFLGLTAAEAQYAMQMGNVFLDEESLTFRIFGTFDAPWGLAAHAGGLALLALSLAFAARTRSQKMLAVGVWGIYTSALIYTSIRGALVGYLIGMSFLLVALLPGGGRSRRALAVFFTVLAAYATFALLFGRHISEGLSPDSVVARRALSILAPEREENMEARVSTWNELQPVVVEYPLGLGLGSTAGVSARFESAVRLGAIHPDNAYFAVLLETGWVGGFLFTAIVFSVLVTGLRFPVPIFTGRDDWIVRGAVAYLIMMAITHLVDLTHVALGVGPFYWLASGVVARACRGSHGAFVNTGSRPGDQHGLGRSAEKAGAR